MSKTEDTMTQASKMPKSQSKTFASDLKLLPKMLRFVKDAAKKVGLQPKAIKQVELAAEEALVNIISYAYKETPKGPIKVSYTASPDGKKLLLEIMDKGVPFNPIEEPVESPRDLSLSERKVGGLGRFFISKLLDQVTYERKGNFNVLKLIKFCD